MEKQVIMTVTLDEMSGSTLIQKLQILQTSELSDVVFIHRTFEGLIDALPFNPSLVIVHLPQASGLHLPSIVRLQCLNYRSRVLMTTDEMPSWSEQVNASECGIQISLLERPFSSDRLVGCIRRLLSETSEQLRYHQRFEFVQPASINVSDRLVGCLVQNVSRGGVCLKLLHSGVLQPEQVIGLSMALNDGNYLRNIKCRVVWVREPDGICGVEFLERSAA